MPQQRWLAILLTAAVADDLITRLRAHRLAKMFLAANDLQVQNRQIQQAQIVYLCHLLNKHEVPIDEFDTIALNSLSDLIE
jgi:hypothetical protein